MKLGAGQVAVVTGGASGIGLALAVALAERGLQILIADVEGERLAAAAEAVAAAGTKVLTREVDVSDFSAVTALAGAAMSTLGGVDVVCNNAGVMLPLAPMWEIEPSAWNWVFDVNVRGVIHGIRAFVPHLVAQGHGHVLNTASASGLSVTAFNGPYSATKHAVVSISEILRAELDVMAPEVGVTVLCPGFTATAITEAARHRPLDVDLPSASGTGHTNTASGPPLEASYVAREALRAMEENKLHLALGRTVAERARMRVGRLLAGLDG